MKFNLLIKKFLVCILSCVMAFAAFNSTLFATFEDDEPPLCVAARDGDLVEVMRLVAEGAEVNCEDERGSTPLHWAVWNGRIGAVRHLVEVGNANVNCVDEYDNTPLHWAAREGNSLAVRFLVGNYHANVNFRNNQGQTPLMLAQEKDYFEIAQMLRDTEDNNEEF